MTGLIVTYSEDEIQAIDPGDFEVTVVEILDDFFSSVKGHSEVTVEWRTATKDHNTLYKVTTPPVIHDDRCYIDIKGGRGGKYKIKMEPNGFRIKTRSSGQEEDLTHLQFRGPGIAVNATEEEIFLGNIPDSVKKAKRRFVGVVDNI